MNSSNNNKKLWLFRAVALCLAFVCLGALELTLQVLQPDLKRQSTAFRLNAEKITERTRSVMKLPDPDLLWVFKPGYRLSEYEKLNSQGFRTREYSQEKKAGTTRIVVIGDSRSFGFGFENRKDSYPEKLRDLLNRQVGSRQFEVINLSILGYTSFQGRQLVQKKVLDLNPDYVVVWFGFNDLLYYHITDAMAAKTNNVFYQINKFVNQLATYHWLRSAFANLRSPEQILDYDQPTLRRVPLPDFRENLISISESLRDIKSKPIFLLSPVRPHVPVVLNSKIRIIEENGRKFQKQVLQYEIDGHWLMDAITFPGTEAELDRLLIENADLAILRYFKGVFLVERGEIEKAAEHFKAARELDETRDTVTEYNNVIREVAQNQKSPCIDLVEKFDQYDNVQLFFDDCHPNNHGTTIIARELFKSLCELEPGLKGTN